MMGHNFYYLCLFLFLSFPLLGRGQEIWINDQHLQQPHSLNPYFTAYADPSGTLLPSTAYQRPDLFVPFSAFNLQKPDQPFWLRLSLHTDSCLSRNHVSIQFKNLTYVDLYVFQQQEILHRQAGAFRKKQFIAQEDNRFNFHLTLLPNQTYTLLFRVWHSKKYQPTANFIIQDQFEYQKNQRFFTTLNYLLLGAIAILFCYSLLSWLITLYIPYLWIFLFLSGIGFHAFSLDPDFIDFFFPNHPETGWLLIFPFLHVGVIGFYLLVLNLLRTKAHPKALYNVGRGLILAIIIFDIFSLLNNGLGSNYYQTHRYHLLLVFVHLSYITAVLITVWKTSDAAQRYWAYGILLYGLGIIFLVLVAFSLKENGYEILGVGSKTFVLLISILFLTGLNKKLKQHERDRLQALQKLNELQREHTALVEQKVEERTLQLAYSNEALMEQQEVLLEKNKHIETLMNELSHRVKNNLQMLYSLNTLQLPKIKEQMGKQILNEMRARIKSMILVNEHLRDFEKDKRIQLALFIQDIADHIQQIYDRDKEVRIITSIQPDMEFNSAVALPFGLVLTELFTNAYKHAFPVTFQQKPTIELTLFEQEGHVLFIFEDNGKGTALIEKNHSMGLSLIEDLVHQLKGRFELHHQHGFRYQFTFLKSV